MKILLLNVNEAMLNLMAAGRLIMGRFQWMGLGILVAATLSGCDLWRGGNDADPVVVQPAPATAPPTPLVPVPSVNTLIQPTNPNERLKVIQGGRVDPFAALVPGLPAPSGSTTSAGSPGAPTLEAGGAPSPGTAAQSSAVSLPNQGRPQPAVAPRAVTRGNATSANRAQPGATPQPSRPSSNSGLELPDLSPNNSANSKDGVALAPPPQPELAKAVQVTGFVVLNGVPRAIVKAPNERVSRTVVAGDRLSDGQVMVKRIEFGNPTEPILVLEEVGVEVAVAAGKPAVQLATATDSLPPIPALW